MYLVTAIQYPQNGKVGECRALLEERVKALQANGLESQLTQTAFGGPDYPTFRLTTRWDKLSGYEKYRVDGLDATRQFTARMTGITRHGAVTVLSEVLQRTSPGSGTKWLQLATLFPTPGKGPELRAAMLEQGKVYETQGRRTNLNVQVAGPDSGAYTRAVAYTSLEELEERRAGNVSDAAFAAYGRTINGLVGREQRTEILEVLVPYPQR